MVECSGLSYSAMLEKTKELQPICFENGTWGEVGFYQGEIMFVIDDRNNGNIRMIGSISSLREKFAHNMIFDFAGKVIAEG